MFGERSGHTLQTTALINEAYLKDRSAEFIAPDEALKSLAEIDTRKSRIVELRFFGGLSAKETAEGLEVSQRTVERMELGAHLALSRVARER